MKRMVKLLCCGLAMTAMSSQANTLMVISPQKSGNIGSYFPLQDAFDNQPSWQSGAVAPYSDASKVEASAPAYEGRYGYIDFGEDFGHIRISQAWTKYRSWSGGEHVAFSQLWWDNDLDTINDGITETQLTFGAAANLPNSGELLWAADMQLAEDQPLIPKGRYLILESAPLNKGRALEYAMVGWLDDYAPPPPVLGAETPVLTMAPPKTFDYQSLKLVDEVTFSQDVDSLHDFKESAAGVSVVQDLLGNSCRVIPNDGDEGKYFAYQLAKGRGLSAGKAYVLVVDYPEDKARSMVVVNNGAEINRGFHTGNTLGDSLYPPYEKPTTESIHYGLSNQIRSWEQLFHLHDRFPELETKPKTIGLRAQLPQDGFWVAISQFGKKDAPLSQGAAVCRIALYEAPSLAQYSQPLTLPPGDLPQRQLFYREEMADGVVTSSVENERGVKDPIDWFEYKARMLKFLGMNTYSQDLLEFGHNQGWDDGQFTEAGKDWYVRSQYPHRWAQMLSRLMINDYQLNIMPYYEYAGSDGINGLGREKVSEPLTRTDGKYTRANWAENINIDVSDPRAVDDALKLIDATLVSQFKGQRPVPRDIGESWALDGEWREGWGFIDFGEHYQDVRIRQGWSRSRMWHGGPATPYSQVIWFNGTDTKSFDTSNTSQYVSEATINFITQPQSNRSYAWSQDFALTEEQAITPRGRFLMFESAKPFTAISEILLVGSNQGTGDDQGQSNQLQPLSVTGGQMASQHDMKYLFDNQPAFNSGDDLAVSGIWLRPRLSSMPQGFGAATLARFAATLPGTPQLDKASFDANEPLLAQYYQWWNGQRQNFLNKIRDHIRQNVDPRAVVLFTADASECGAQHPTANVRVVTDDVGDWSGDLSSTKVLAFDQSIKTQLHLAAQTLPHSTWGGYEYQHSIPRADAINYQANDGVMMTYSFNDLYTVSDPASLQQFNSQSGTAAIRHYCLNEDAMYRAADTVSGREDILGYFVSDIELAGPYITLPEARALANGDPYYFGYLSSNSFNRGFPGYVRAFNAHYLALPALPSIRDDSLTSDQTGAIAVRTITTAQQGTWLAVINTGLKEVNDLAITLPVGGLVLNAATGEEMTLVDNKVVTSMYPGQLLSLRVVPAL